MTRELSSSDKENHSPYQSQTKSKTRVDQTQAEPMDLDEDATQDAPQRPPAYDPEQDPNERRAVRAALRVAQQQVEDQRQRIDTVDTAELIRGLENADELFERVKAPAEATLDSKTILGLTELTLQQAKKLKVGSTTFDTESLVSRLARIVGVAAKNNPKGKARATEVDDDDDGDNQISDVALYEGWDKIGRLATKYTQRVQACDFMLGPLSIVAKKRTVKARAKFTKDPNEKVVTKDVSNDDTVTDETQATKMPAMVARVLTDEGGAEGLNYFKFVINPFSYAQTVENIFYTSFLCKEGHASLEIIDGEPMCLSTDQPEQGDHAPKMAFVLNMDRQMWRDAIEAYNITKPMIEDRGYHDDDTDDKLNAKVDLRNVQIK